MNNETKGGSTAESALKVRLARRFAQELVRAEQDYPSLPARQWDTAERLKGPRRVWRRLAVEAVAVLVLVGVLAVAYGRPSPESAAPSAAPSAGLGSDGIPTQIDGQRVYRVTDKAEWQNLSGPFLLGGFAVQQVTACPVQTGSIPPAEAGLLIDPCRPWVNLGILPGYAGSAELSLAQPGSEPLFGWSGGPAVVVRVHTHDAHAAQCAAGSRAECEAAVVVEAIVWPIVPTEIGGERVYRATDRASFTSLKGSFLLGGVVTYPDVVSPCPTLAGPPGDGQDLLPYCYPPSIDALALSPHGTFDEPKNEIVVARVHVNDPLAAGCNDFVRDECNAAIVVESVVWRSNPYGPAASAPVEITSTPGTVVSPPPTPIIVLVTPAAPDTGSFGPGTPPPLPVQLGPDGLPTTYDGKAVLRVSAMPTRGSFLVGGQLAYTSTCAGVNCGSWKIDGVTFGFANPPGQWAAGGNVVAKVTVTETTFHCLDQSKCPPVASYQVTDIVWYAAPAAATSVVVPPTTPAP
jgi:hypothetical protein